MLTAKQKEQLRVRLASYMKSAGEVKSPFVETLPDSATSKTKLPGEPGGLKTETKTVKLPGDPNEYTKTQPSSMGTSNITKGETNKVKENKEKAGTLPIDPNAFNSDEKINDKQFKEPGNKSNITEKAQSGEPKGVQQQPTVPINWNKRRVPDEKAPFKKQFSQVSWFKKQADVPMDNAGQKELLSLKDKLAKGETLTPEEMDKVSKAQTPGA